ncbi:TetR/AcrR family transcriptional regulator [Shimia aestuarii]|uniref:TetR/AcrR family transcriptional regulator n=1 Tax=Shimia aestuarii TaxID=254406 RepID=UPI001FB45ADD|nr:TetR/AcrR family transcriptional regulator [Shimia aestuarii]
MLLASETLIFSPMNEMPSKLKARAERKNAKRDVKKRQIAESAILALQELGYANTSLRDIAEKSDMSLGMLHYYFEDRSELIIYCVSIYKQQFVSNIVDALAGAEGRDSVIETFSNALAESITDDAMTHRLWYDIRSQAMFDETFRPIVREIEEMLVGIVADALEKAGHPIDETLAIQYALIDGVFLHLMQRQISDGPQDTAEVAAVFRGIFEKLL